MYMSRGEELTGGRERVSILADCVEAVLAAIYLDKGFDEVKRYIIKNFKGIISKAINNEIILDYKTKLQEILQKNGEVQIQYNLNKHEGPPHRREFFVNVTVNNKVMGQGVGYSKKEAEQVAAKEAIERLEENCDKNIILYLFVSHEDALIIVCLQSEFQVTEKVTARTVRATVEDI